jgi:hypothetical protein
MRIFNHLVWVDVRVMQFLGILSFIEHFLPILGQLKFFVLHL